MVTKWEIVKKITLAKMQNEKEGNGKTQTGIIQETKGAIKNFEEWFKKLMKYYSKAARDTTVAKL